MRQKHNTLLAGVAALALLAGGGIAAAQQNPQSQNKAGASMGAPSAAPTPSAKPGAAGGMEQHAQTASPSPKNDQPPAMARQGAANGKAENRTAQTDQKAGRSAKQSAQMSPQLGKNTKSSSEAKQRVGENAKEPTKENTKQTAKSENTSQTRERLGATEKGRHERIGANTRTDREHNRISERSKRKDELKGLQGNTSIPMQGSHVNLTSRQRTTIRDSVIDARGAPRVGHVDFDVAVGTVVPRDRIHVVPVPETLVRIDPQWHGYLYFIVEDQVIIVNPRDMRIVAVLAV